MTRILDQYGEPLDRAALAALKAPQTSRVAALENQFLTPMLGGLTPDRLAGILRRADDGDLTAQHRLFSDMEERDAHLQAEMNKRKLAVMGLDWDIVPPRNATPAEERAAEWVKETLLDAVIPLEDLILSMMDGVGHGFAAIELVWRREGGEWLPEFAPRPQEWFQLDRTRRELRLIDHSAEGQPLTPFGWVLHTHGTPKTGYLGRGGLFRCLVWPFLYKSYGLGDFAEFIEIYGLPIVLGKYYQGATADEKASLMRAVTALGHDARAIMPADMQLEIQKVTADGSGTPHLAMVEWCDAAISKAILGATLTSGTAANGNRALGEVHDAVRRDIRDADARQIAATITLDLIYPLIALNVGGVDGLRRCPRLVFDDGRGEDIGAYADALPKLVTAGLNSIPAAWVHEKLRIPMPQDGEAVLQAPYLPAPGVAGLKAAAPAPAPAAAKGVTLAEVVARLFAQPQLAVLTATAGLRGESAGPVDGLADQLSAAADASWGQMVDVIALLVEGAPDLPSLQRALVECYGGLGAEELTRLMAAAFALAELKGMDEARGGA